VTFYRDTAAAAKTPLYKSLYFQVLVAVVAGACVGLAAPAVGEDLKVLSESFINLIKMMIAPIIFCTVVLGIAGARDLRQVGGIGVKALVYFQLFTVTALVIGLVVVNVLRPGDGIHAELAAIDRSSVSEFAQKAHEQGLLGFVTGAIPDTVVGAFTSGNLLQVLLISLLFAVALCAVGGTTAARITAGIEGVSHVLFRMIGYVMRLAPIGAFGGMAFTVGKYGLDTLGQLAALMACFYATCLLFVFVVLGTVMKFNGLSLVRFLRYIKEELIIVLGTSSTEPVLPRMLAKLQNLGASKSVVGVTLPAGYSFNLDGSAIYLTMATVFLAQAFDIDLSLGQQLGLLAVMLLTSKGGAGVTGSGFIVLASTLSTTQLVPVAALALIVGIDRFMSEARALTSLVGNGVATIAVARWDKSFDDARAKAILEGREVIDTDHVEDPDVDLRPVPVAPRRVPVLAER
jgi:aerobic C4-dicarboxylate transport protein